MFYVCQNQGHPADNVQNWPMPMMSIQVGLANQPEIFQENDLMKKLIALMSVIAFCTTIAIAAETTPAATPAVPAEKGCGCEKKAEAKKEAPGCAKKAEAKKDGCGCEKKADVVPAPVAK